jgi:predicted metal-binding membrane protein
MGLVAFLVALAALGWFVGVWIVMMAAMMLPESICARLPMHGAVGSTISWASERIEGARCDASRRALFR